MSTPMSGQGVEIGHIAAGEDLSAAQYRAVVIRDGGWFIADAADTDGADGILLNAPESGQPALVRVTGTAPFIGGTGGVSRGNSLTHENGGALVTASTGDSVLGKCVTAAAAGAQGEMLISKTGDAT